MKRLAGEDLVAVIIAGAGSGWLLATRNHGPLWLSIQVLMFIFSSAALFGHVLKKQWSHLFAGLVFATASLHFLLSGIFNGWSFVRIIFAPLCAIFAWNLMRKGLKNGEEEKSDDRAMVSIVALVKSLPFLDETVLRNHVTKAWGVEFDPTDDEATSFVVGDAPMFIVKCERGMFMVHFFNRPYFDDPQEVAAATRNMRVIDVLKEHQAWFSVDYMESSRDVGDVSEQFALVGKLLAEIVDDDCLGLLLPTQDRLLPWESEFMEALSSDNPLESLCPELLPVVAVDGKDPRILAAAAKARETFPQFERAFEQRADSDQSYAVKAPITVGENTEFIWLEVTAIEGGVIYGELGNDPVNLGDMKEGDPVSVQVEDLNDWIYTYDNDFEGGFTVNVLAEISSEPRDKNGD